MTSAICKLRSMVGGPAPRSRATHRLEDMLTHEVSLVEAAANRRDFLFRKSAPLVMPAAYRSRMIAEVISMIIECDKLARMLREAQVDDTRGIDHAIVAQLRRTHRTAVHAVAAAEPRAAA